MRDGKSNHEEISPSEKKEGEGIPTRFAQRGRGGRKGIPMRKGEPQSTTVARKRERVQNGAPSSGIINVTDGSPQTDDWRRTYKRATPNRAVHSGQIKKRGSFAASQPGSEWQKALTADK